MAKINEPSGETVVKGKGGREMRPPPPRRRFPFRLLLWALLMTGAAGAGGYYAYRFYTVADERKDEVIACMQQLGPAETELQGKRSQLTACEAQRETLATEQSDIKAQLDKMSSDFNATSEELTALRAQRTELEKRAAAIENIQQKFRDMIDTGELAVTSRRGSLVVELPSEVLFPSASAELSRKGEVAVLQVGGILKQFDDRRFLVIGHTDAQPLKSAQYKDNWELSVARALKVTRFLVEGGMRPTHLVAAGVGEHDPIADNKSSEGRAKNRRIEIVLLPALSELPPLPASLEEAGKKAEEAAGKKGK
jgi:chemotaxis protein MotB